MNKLFLRLLIVVLLIAGITTIVYFVLHKPNKDTQIYQDYAKLIQDDSYNNFDYFTKNYTNSELPSDSNILGLSEYLKKHYVLVSAIKNQIESELVSIRYANHRDEEKAKIVNEKLDIYNDLAYGQDNVAVQAKYLYEYYDKYYLDSDAQTIDTLVKKLTVTMHKMEVAGNDVLQVLNEYVCNNVYNGTKPNDYKFVLNDAYALVACASTQYTNENGDVDDLHLHYGNFEKYITKLNAVCILGERDGYKDLVSEELSSFVNSYNQVARETILGMLLAENRVNYITGQEDENTKNNLMIVYNYLEAAL